MRARLGTAYYTVPRTLSCANRHDSGPVYSCGFASIFASQFVPGRRRAPRRASARGRLGAPCATGVGMTHNFFTRNFDSRLHALLSSLPYLPLRPSPPGELIHHSKNHAGRPRCVRCPAASAEIFMCPQPVLRSAAGSCSLGRRSSPTRASPDVSRRRRPSRSPL